MIEVAFHNQPVRLNHKLDERSIIRHFADSETLNKSVESGVQSQTHDSTDIQKHMFN